MRLGVLELDDLMTEDALVLAKLDASGSRQIAEKLESDPLSPARVASRGYLPRIVPKERWLDPPVLINGTVKRLSVLGTKAIAASPSSNHE